MIFNKDRMDKDQVLKDLDSLGYSDRMKRIALLGRQHKEDAAYSNLLLSLLEGGGAYEAQLALTGASVVNDANIVLFALKHPKAGGRNRAAGLLPKVVTARDIHIESEIVTMSHDCRHKLLRSIADTYRQDWAERLLPLVFTRWGGKEASLLLSACGEETVRNRLTELGYALRNWRTLTKRHPDLVAVYFQTSLKSAPPREKGNVWWRFSSAIEVLSILRPNIVLECALKHGPMDTIHPVLKQQLGSLVQVNPDAVFELLTREESRSHLMAHGVPEGVLKRKSLLSIDQWTKLATLLADHPLHVAALLGTLAPSHRGKIFEAAYEEDKRKLRIFPEKLLDVLPHKLRDREAARMQGLREINDHRDKMLSITARRLIIHSREKLEQEAYVSNSDDRATAYAQLIKSTALSRRGMDETLLFLTRIKNDQDVVRGAVMAELSNCPTPIFKEEHVGELTLLVDSVIEARDTSFGTRAATEKLAFAILRDHASEPGSGLLKFSLRTFGRLAKRDGQFMLSPMRWGNLPKSVVKILFDEIYSLGVEANKRENYNFVLQMADSFGKSGHRLPKLQLLLEELVKAKSVPPQAIRHWLAPYQTRDERVKELLARDKSFISVNEVFMHLHQKRQEWLDPFISGAVIKGELLSGKTIYLVPATEGFHRWLPRQQKSLGALLERVALDAKRSYYERSAAIRSLARMPDFCSDKLLELLQDEEVSVVEAALYAHSLLEEPEKALPILLDNLDGDRARVAMYAIPRCIRRVKPILLTSMLTELLNRDKLKITVRKEAIRLLGAFKSSDSMSLLIREFEKPNAHKDVIIAIGHAAKQWLDDERSWAIMRSMASSLQSDIARSLLNQHPEELPIDARPRYLQLIVEVAGHADAAVGRDAFHAMTRWAQGSEEIIAATAARAIVNLEDSSRWKAAMDALIVICRDGKVNEQVIEIYKKLAGTEVRDEWNAAAERDLPHRQRLLRLTDKLTSLPKNVRRALALLYLGIIDCLGPNETMKHTVIKLYLAVIDWNHVEEAVAYLNRVIHYLTRQPHLLNYTYRQIAQDLKASKGHWSPEAVLEIVDTMGAEDCFESLYIGLSLLEVAGTTLLWSPDCTNRLRAYRNHENAAICSLALDIWTAIE